VQDWEQEALDAVNAELEDMQTVTWKQVTNGAVADSSKPWIPGDATPVEFTTQAVILPSNRKALSAIMFSQGIEIPDGYSRGLLPGDCGFTPKLKDFVTDAGGTTYSVEWVDVLKPAGNPLLWYLGLRPS
jgi:hypothetical protein